MSDWSDEEIANLRALWEANISTPSIGRRLGRSNNSICGKIDRLGLPKRVARIRRDGIVGRAKTAKPKLTQTLPDLRSTLTLLP